MNKLLLKTFNKRRIFLIGCDSLADIDDKRYQIKKLMKDKGDIEFIYAGSVNKIKPFITERVVDSHPTINGLYDGGKYRNYMNLTEKSRLNSSESLQSAVLKFHQLYNISPEFILIIQV